MLSSKIRPFIVVFACVAVWIPALNRTALMHHESLNQTDTWDDQVFDGADPSKLTFPPKLELSGVSLFAGPAEKPPRRFQHRFGKTKAFYRGLVEFKLTNIDKKAVVIDPLIHAKAWLLYDGGESAAGISNVARDSAFRLIRVGDNELITLESGQTLSSTAEFELAFIPDSARKCWFALELGDQLAMHRFLLGRIADTTSPNSIRK